MGAKWLEKGRPVELLVVPENTYATSMPIFWNGEGEVVDAFTVYLCGPRKSRAAAHFGYIAWVRTTPTKLQERTGLLYPNLQSAQDFDVKKQRALCDFVIREFTTRLSHARGCEGNCECVGVSLAQTDWATGPNWVAVFVQGVLSRDLEDAHLTIDDQSSPIM